MKRTNRLITLAGVLSISCLATFAASKYEEKQEAIKNTDTIILELPADTIQSVSWESGNTGFSFYKGEDGWIYKEDEAFPVNDEVINDILSLFEGFGASFIIEEAQELSQYGLEDPECTISLNTDDTEYTLKLGNFSKMDEQRYVDIGDGNVYLVSKDPMDYLETDLSDMILHDKLPSLKNAATEITFTGLENYSIIYEEENTASYSEEDVYVTQKDSRTLPLDSDRVKDYLSTISSLSLTDYVTYNATDEELAAYGMHEPALSVSVDYTYYDEDENKVSDTFVLHISENPDEADAAAKAEAADKSTIPSVTKYARVGDSQIVYKITDTSYNTLTASSHDDFRHQEVFWADPALVTQMDITLENETHTLTTHSDKEDVLWYYGEEEIDTTDLFAALKALTADSFTEEAAEKKEELSLTLYLNNEDFPTVHIQLYRYDGTKCLAIVDGESISLVERSLVVDLIEAVQSIVLN